MSNWADGHSNRRFVINVRYHRSNYLYFIFIEWEKFIQQLMLGLEETVRKIWDTMPDKLKELLKSLVIFLMEGDTQKVNITLH